MTEKSLNMQKLSGEQDKDKNKIRYTKWRTQINDFVESKGRAGALLKKATDWAIKEFRRDKKVTDADIEHSTFRSARSNRSKKIQRI